MVAILNSLGRLSDAAAGRWFDSLDTARSDILERPGSFPLAPQAESTGLPIRYCVFGTPRGKPYCLYFRVDADEVSVLRVTAPGQQPPT